MWALPDGVEIIDPRPQHGVGIDPSPAPPRDDHSPEASRLLPWIDPGTASADNRVGLFDVLTGQVQRLGHCPLHGSNDQQLDLFEVGCIRYCDGLRET